MARESFDGRSFTQTGKFKRGNRGSFDTDLEEARIAEANARHDAEMKRLGRGFLDQTRNAMGIARGNQEKADKLNAEIEAECRKKQERRKLMNLRK